MRPAFAALLVLAGCGGGASECTAIFSGNFADFVSGKAVCPKLQRLKSSSVLTFDVTAAAAKSRLSVVVDLGPSPAPGTFSSQAAGGTWWATSTREPGCVYAAGAQAVPAGQFTLTLDSLDAKSGLHGALWVLQGVHALDGFDCGAGDEERAQVEF